MSHGKQFTLYSHYRGPNGWKVAMVLEELGLTYHTIYLDFDAREHKDPGYVALNPNGRIPTLVDHANDDFTVWESNAITAYLVERYDAAHTISVSDFEERAVQLQWLFFQASGQGPYFGQAGWFMHAHPEKIPSAIVRYQKETLRVLSVLEDVLSKQEWLVGGRCTVADLSFIMWNHLAVTFSVVDYEGFDFERDLPAVYKWHNAMLARPAIKKCMEAREDALNRYEGTANEAVKA